MVLVLFLAVVVFLVLLPMNAGCHLQWIIHEIPHSILLTLLALFPFFGLRILYKAGQHSRFMFHFA